MSLALGGRRLDGTMSPLRRRALRLVEDVTEREAAGSATGAGRPGTSRARADGWLDRAIALIAEHLPASEAEVTERLTARGVIEAAADLARIERAARHRPSGPPFAVLRREGLAIVVRPGDLALAKRVHMVAMHAVAKWAAASLESVALQAQTDDVALVEAIVSRRERFHWLDRPRGWFWFRAEKAPLIDTIERVLALVGRARAEDLHLAILRRWPPEAVLPEAVLATLCGEVRRFRVEGGWVRLAPGTLARPRPTDEEHRVLKLFALWGPRIEGFRIPAVCRRMDLGVEEVSRLLRSSPLVMQLRPGVFQLVGTGDPDA
jgi:hypothetical protein